MKAYKDNSIDICSLYYKEVGHFPPLTADKEKEIRHSVVNGTMTAQKGRELLINGNLRLVVTVAKRYSDKGMPLEDLIQAGNMGLIEAANAFDWSRDAYFSSYATHYIKKEIFLCLRHGHRHGARPLRAVPLRAAFCPLLFGLTYHEAPADVIASGDSAVCGHCRHIPQQRAEGLPLWPRGQRPPLLPPQVPAACCGGSRLGHLGRRTL